MSSTHHISCYFIHISQRSKMTWSTALHWGPNSLNICIVTANTVLRAKMSGPPPPLPLNAVHYYTCSKTAVL